MRRIFEWGVVIATILFVLSIVPRHCARLAYFLHPKLGEINAVLFIPQLITLTLWRTCGVHQAYLGLPTPCERMETRRTHYGRRGEGLGVGRHMMRSPQGGLSMRKVEGCYVPPSGK